MSVIALIPARGGSKRIPRKNVRLFAGLPMVAHPIRIARESGVFDRIIVSTDDEEVAAVAREHGAEVPFVRPPELADDHTPVVEVVRHAVRALQDVDQQVKFVCRIFATAALISPVDLIAGYEQMKRGARFAMGVKAFPHPLERAIRLTEQGHVQMIQPEHFASRTQDLPQSYFDAGQFCWGTPEAFLFGAPPMLSAGTAGIKLPAFRGLDIDTEEDWELAEAVFQFYAPQSSTA